MINWIKNNALLLLLLLFLATSASSAFFYKVYIQEKTERKRVEQNQNALLKQEQNKYKVLLNEKDSIEVLSTQQLVLTKNEFKENRDSLLEIIESLNIKLRRVQSVTNIDAGVDVGFNAPIKDSIIYITKTDTTYLDTLKCVEYKDAFNSFSACISNDTMIDAKIHIDVPIIQIAHRIPKFEFWFIRLGTKHIKQEILSKNPNATIKYAEVIELKK